MEQIVIARKKIMDAARLLAAANERALAEEARALADQVDQQQRRPSRHERETWEALFRALIEGAQNNGANRHRP